MTVAALEDHTYEALGTVPLVEEQQRLHALSRILGSVPHIMRFLQTIRDENLPDGWLVSGGIYQTVWNVMTERPLTHGIKDYDIIYFDGQDTSYEAEDQVIKRINSALPDMADLIEVRNQARVHLWYEKRFGHPCRPLDCSMDALTTYAARTHAVAARLDADDRIVVHAPFGLANLFAMRLVPNYQKMNAKTYTEKAVRMKRLWPELEVIDWETTDN